MEHRIAAVARDKADLYRRYVEKDDLIQELWVYVLGDGKPHLDKFIADGDEFRVMRALHGAAKQYCEREKAVQSGYSFEDVAWYSPLKLAELIPLALDGGWDGLTGEGEEGAGSGKTDGREGGTLVAMIADIRRVMMKRGFPRMISAYNPETEAGMAYLTALADALGGEYPNAPGYGRGRRAVSNATARALTENEA